MSTDEMLEHWQGHRRLTRRLIEAFPEDQLFTFTIGGMRSFGVLATEMLTMAEPMVSGVVTAEWITSWDRSEKTKQEVLKSWDESTARINELWKQIPAERFHETIKAFGQYEGTVWSLLMYVIDNEIHHRGQGFVYARALGIEPPPFWERQ